jgi:hypothetical protein
MGIGSNPQSGVANVKYSAGPTAIPVGEIDGQNPAVSRYLPTAITFDEDILGDRATEINEHQR